MRAFISAVLLVEAILIVSMCVKGIDAKGITISQGWRILGMFNAFALCLMVVLPPRKEG